MNDYIHTLTSTNARKDALFYYKLQPTRSFNFAKIMHFMQ